MSDTEKKTVVVIGGQFAGQRIYRLLAADYTVVLVDSKGYFEFTPSVLRCFVEPAAAAAILVEQPRGAITARAAAVKPSPGASPCGWRAGPALRLVRHTAGPAR
jgi:hypothetical protein